MGVFLDVSFFINVKKVNRIVIIKVTNTVILYSIEFKNIIKSGEDMYSYSVLSKGKLNSPFGDDLLNTFKK